jgi:hypothetical protein
MGLSLAARSSGENGPRHGDVAHALGALAARSPLVVRTCGSVVSLADGLVVPAGQGRGSGQAGWAEWAEFGGIILFE